ncbi:hypothetical protein EAE96_008679 [Botrytis aclada]|nr:hypothetical protein EAE96_008679 [Botrytis aclada]
MACWLTYHDLNTSQQRLRSFMTIRDPGRETRSIYVPSRDMGKDILSRNAG